MKNIRLNRHFFGKLQINQYEPISFLAGYEADIEEGDDRRECNRLLFQWAQEDVKEQMIEVKKRKKELLENRIEKKTLLEQIQAKKENLNKSK